MPAIVTDNAMALYKRRYFSNGESLDGMFRRVADGDERFIELMSEGLFLPNSPTLFNAGLDNGGTLSACFVFEVADSLLDGGSSIVASRAKAAAVAKAGGGVGYYLGHIRPKGSLVRSVHREACGPIPVLRDLNSLRQLITQGGKRDLAQMAVLDSTHPDILDFVACKDEDPQALSSFNISVSWKDGEFRAAVAGVEPHATVWRKQTESAHRTGDPGCFFFDAVNRANPNIRTVGLIRAPNPCGETPNRDNEPCNLGSIVLWRLVNLLTRAFDFDKLYRIAYLCTEFLDDILDRNVFPHPDIAAAALATRKLGLGVMGWADTLALMGVAYASEEALRLGERIMRIVAKASYDASIDLAKSKGPYAAYDADRTEGPCRRNETGTSIAPTGTIAILANCNSSIEPFYALEWERTTYEGMKLHERIAVHEHLDGHVPQVANEIPWEWHVRHQAVFQKYTDLGVSKTVNLPNSATVQDVAGAYALMHRLECKGGTVFRDGCRREQVLVAKGSVYSLPSAAAVPARRKLPDECGTRRVKFSIGGHSGYLHVGLYEDGSPGEVFLRMKTAGSTLSGVLNSWAIGFSNSLQRLTPLVDLVRQHRGSCYEPNGLTGNKDVPTCTSIPDFVVRWLACKYLSADEAAASSSSGVYCPECGADAVRQAGCLTCKCGWSRCS